MIDSLVAISDILIDDTIVLYRKYSRTCDIPDDGDLGDEVDRDSSKWINDSGSSGEQGS